MHLANLILAALLACSPSVLAARKKDDAILLSKVKSLTLRDGFETSHRRVAALPQLHCVGGNARGLYSVDVMRCTNSGSEYDSEDISWTCKAELPPEFKLGSTEVICEGYDSPEDPFVLRGSCGVEYRLVLTEVGERKYKGWVDEGARKGRVGKKEGGDGLAAVLFWIVFVGIVLVIAYSIFFPNRNNNVGRRAGNRGGGGGGGGGWGGDDGHDDPPPPYTPRAPKPKTTSSRSSGSSSRQQQSQGWQPGFWTGAATGAAAGYGASAWANRNRQQQPAYGQAGPSGWFGGNNNARSGFGAGPSTFGSGSSNSPPAPSSSRQESTGFGGTQRR